MTLPESIMTESDEQALLNIDKAIEQAGLLLDLADAPWGDSPEADAYREEVFEERFHCGVCTVRVVMETVWPAIEDYISDLKAKQVAAEFALETRILLDGLHGKRDSHTHPSEGSDGNHV